MKCLEISVAAFLGQSVKEVRPPATCAEKRLVGRTSRKAAETSIRKLCACRLPRASLSQKFGRLRLVPKSGLSAELLDPRGLHFAWQSEAENRSLTLTGALGADRAAVGEHQVLADGQPQARAGACSRRIGLVEALEHPRQLIRVDAHASIGHPELH